jgi:hypothetical protein
MHGLHSKYRNKEGRTRESLQRKRNQLLNSYACRIILPCTEDLYQTILDKEEKKIENEYIDLKEYYKTFIEAKVNLTNVEFKENTDDLTCSICLELFSYPVTLNCLHTFCEQCLLKNTSKKCALCRNIYKSDQYFANETVKSNIKKLTIIKCNDCDKQHTIENYCTLYCKVCNVQFKNTKREHVFNQCCGFGVIKYCFTCKQYVKKIEYDTHKKLCYNKHFSNNFTKLQLY